MKKSKNKFIIYSIIAIVIILFLLLLFVPNGIIDKVKQSTSKQLTESSAKDKIASALSLALSEKNSNSAYNSDTFLTNFLQEQNIVVNSNIVSLGNWNFKIDRENLTISESLGATQVSFTNDIINYFTGTTSDGKRIVTARINVSSNIELDKIIFENVDGSITTEEVNSSSYTKDIDILMDKDVLITTVTKDGKTKLNKFKELSEGKFDSLLTVAQTCLKETGYYTVDINGISYNIHAYVYDSDTTLAENTTFGEEADVATASTYAKNMVLVKVNGDLTINSGVTVTSYSNTYGGPKGMFILSTGTLTNNGTISMSSKGAKAVGENVYLWKNDDDSYEYVPANGASGSNSTTSTKSKVTRAGGVGSTGIARKTRWWWFWWFIH